MVDDNSKQMALLLIEDAGKRGYSAKTDALLANAHATVYLADVVAELLGHNDGGR